MFTLKGRGPGAKNVTFAPGARSFIEILSSGGYGCPYFALNTMALIKDQPFRHITRGEYGCPYFALNMMIALIIFRTKKTFFVFLMISNFKFSSRISKIALLEKEGKDIS